MDMSAVASAATEMKNMDVASQVAVRVAKMAMEMAEQSAEAILQIGLGENIDITA